MISNIYHSEIEVVFGSTKDSTLGEFISSQCDCVPPLALNSRITNLTLAECIIHCCIHVPVSYNRRWLLTIFNNTFSGFCYREVTFSQVVIEYDNPMSGNGHNIGLGGRMVR